MRTTLLISVLAATAAWLPAQAAHHWIVPSRACMAPAGQDPGRITAVTAQVRIVDRAAVTTLEFELHNPTARDQEAVLLLPVPDDVAVSHFTFDGAASEPQARILPRDEARRLYDEITARLRDPALAQLLKVVGIKGMCREANVAKIDVGPKGAVISFRGDSFANPGGLVGHIQKNMAVWKLRPDQKIVVKGEWDRPAQRLDAAEKILSTLAKLAKAA